MEIYLKAWKYGLKATYYAFMPAKIKTEGKYVHEDIKETQSSQTTQKETVNSGSRNGKKDKLVESGNLMSLDELMKKEGYCEECGN